MARFVVSAVVGVAVGIVSQNPVAGLQAFSLTYGLTASLDPGQKFQGPRLDDLKGPQLSYGQPIAYCEGSPRLAGSIIWASEKREIATTRDVGGKGPPSAEQTTYTYEMDVLYQLSINEIEGVRRIWSNGELVWSLASDADDATIGASVGVPTGSDDAAISTGTTDKWRGLRVYTGAVDQLPDPTYEAAVGVGNAPAYRGRGTVFIEGLQLFSGGQLPVLTFELSGPQSSGVSVRVGAIVADPQAGLFGGLVANGSGLHVLQRVETDGSLLDYVVTNMAYDGFVSIDPGSDVTSAGFFADNFGYADAPCAVKGRLVPTLTSFDFYTASTYVIIDPGVSVDPRCAYKSGILYMGANNGTSFTRFNGLTGGLTHSVTLPSAVQYVTASASSVWAMSLGGSDVYEIDPDDLTLLDTFASPAAGNSSVVLADTDGTLHCAVDVAGIGQLYRRDGGAWTLINSDLGNCKPGDQSSGSVPDRFAMRNGAIYRLVGATGGETEAVVYTAAVTFDLNEQLLSDVISRLCLRTGLLTADQIDVSALTTIVVRGLAVSQVTPTRAVLQSLMSAYLLEAVESDGKIKFVRRGGSVALTIPFEDLGASQGDPVEPLPLRRLNDVELPSFVTVKFANTLNDYQDGSESGDRLVTQSTAVQLIEIPLGLEPQEAKRIADVATMDIATSIITVGPASVDRRYAALEPTDVVLLEGQTGSTYRSRIVKATDSQGVRTLECVLDDATAVNSAAETDEGYTSSTIVRVIAASELLLLDIPSVRTDDATAGIYAAIKPIGDGRFPGAALNSSPDGINYSQIATFAERAVFGEATSVLGSFSGHVYDLTNSVTVDVGATLSSTTRADVDAGLARPFLIGDEVIYALTATYQSPGVYKLSNLLRNLFGTEGYTHVSGERVVLLQPTGMRRIEHQIGDIGLTRHYKAVSFGKSFDSAESQAFIDTGVSLRPYSPTDGRVARDLSDNATITWMRRSRLAPRYGGSGGSYTPTGESIEAYQIDVYADDTFATVVRTISVTEQEADYSAADQTSDGLTPGDPLSLRIYQISAVVGRGKYLEVTA